MKIQTVVANLRTTIAGKEEYLAKWKEVEAAADRTGYETVIGNTVIRMLGDNINELKHILQDVEQCIPKEYTMGDWMNDLENPHGNR